jgi:phosphoribosyl-ATP pyrophosphohydrolase/phosphoribosyl-AMP cyclohydrolase
VVSLYYDCDQDALLLKVIQKGVACHTGNRSCFYTPVFENDQSFDLNTLNTIILDRKIKPKEGSYTKYLFDQGLDKVLKKVGEESAEVIIASKNSDDELIEETSDLLYHLVVLLVLKGISIQTIFETLKKRQRVHDKT